MPNRIEPLVQYLRNAVRPPNDADVTDGQLLTRFIARRDEHAFATLVQRHGPTVFAVCQRLVRNRADAEDAFQATFLVLVRKARSIASGDAVGSWLHAVAYRTAQRLRAIRNMREQQVTDMPEVEARPDNPGADLHEVLDRELNALPEKYRLPVVLCELEGRSRKEVARQLGLAEGTLSWRLAAARKILAKRLAKYGPFSAAAISSILSANASASLPPALAGSTVKCVLAGGTATVAALAAGVLKTMFLTKLKTVSWAVALVFTLAAGVAGVRVVTAQAPASVPAALSPATQPSHTRGVWDELDVMRLEIEALRKDLKITKDRVRALEATSADTKGASAATTKKLVDGDYSLQKIFGPPDGTISLGPIIRVAVRVDDGKPNYWVQGKKNVSPERLSAEFKILKEMGHATFSLECVGNVTRDIVDAVLRAAKEAGLRPTDAPPHIAPSVGF